MWMLFGTSHLRKTRATGWRLPRPRRRTSGVGWRRRGATQTKLVLRRSPCKPRPSLRGRGLVSPASAEEMETRLGSLRDRLDKTEASTRAEVEQTHTQLVDAYRELGARTAPFEAPGQEVGLRFLGWLQEELEVLPTIVMGLMSFASLVTCEGAVNALSREGCGHFEAFDQSDEGFEREIFQV
jgi:hypothetical protein